MKYIFFSKIISSEAIFKRIFVTKKLFKRPFLPTETFQFEPFTFLQKISSHISFDIPSTTLVIRCVGVCVFTKNNQF